MAKGVQLCGCVDHLAHLGQMATFGDHYDAIMLAVIVVVLEQRANVVDIDILFRNQDHVRPARHAGGVGDPTGVAGP